MHADGSIWIWRVARKTEIWEAQFEACGRNLADFAGESQGKDDSEGWCGWWKVDERHNALRDGVGRGVRG